MDATPPAMGQVLLRDGQIRLEFDEPVVGDELRDAVGDGRLRLERIFGDGTTESVPVGIEQEAPFVIPPLEPQGLIAEMQTAETEERPSLEELLSATVGVRSTAPLASGQGLHFRRVFLRPTQPLGEGVQVRLTVAAEAIQDRFQNQASQGIDETFNWTSTGTQVVADTAPPEVRAVRLRGNRLEIEFSEEPDLGTLSAIELGPATAGLEGLELGTSEQPTWQLQDDSVTVTTEEPLPSGERQLTIGTGVADLVGRTLVEVFAGTVGVPTSLADVQIFQADEDGVLESSSVGNRHGFHGRPVDPETGLIFFRNRYYSPELGRFLTPDPMGYLDGPSMYGFAGYSPQNFHDPLGLELDFRQAPGLELTVVRLRGRSTKIDATLKKYEGEGAPDLIFAREGDLPRDADGTQALQHFLARPKDSWKTCCYEQVAKETKRWEQKHADARAKKGDKWEGRETLTLPPIFWATRPGVKGSDSLKFVDPATVELDHAYVVVSIRKNRAGFWEEAYTLIHELGHADHAVSNPWEYFMLSANDEKYKDFDLEFEVWANPVPHDEREVEKKAEGYRDEVGRELGVQNLRDIKDWRQVLKRSGFWR